MHLANVALQLLGKKKRMNLIDDAVCGLPLPWLRCNVQYCTGNDPLNQVTQQCKDCPYAASVSDVIVLLRFDGCLATVENWNQQLHLIPSLLVHRRTSQASSSSHSTPPTLRTVSFTPIFPLISLRARNEARLYENVKS